MIAAKMILGGRVCIREDFVLVGQDFRPPSLDLSGELSDATVVLYADIGDFTPSGLYVASFFLDGNPIGSVEVLTPGRYTISSDASAFSAVAIRCWIDVRSSLPLPTWTGHREWVFPAPSFFVIDLAATFPNDLVSYGEGWWHGLSAGENFGPYPDDRWVYSHSDDPCGADDALAINGTVWPDFGYIHGGATTLLLYLPRGSTFNVNIWNSGGWVYAVGRMRLYDRPI